MRGNKPFRAFVLTAAFMGIAVSAFGQGRPDALKAYLAGKYEESRVICLKEIEFNPRNLESYVVLSWSLISLGKYADAELYARKAYDTVRKDPRIIESLGEAAYFLGKNEDALRWFQTYINVLPEGTRIDVVYYYMGEVYIRTGKYNRADIAIRTALQFSPNNARWWARLGYARERTGDLRYALEAYEKALAYSPQLNDAVLGKERVSKAISQ
ncbi:MAG: tetratricopeptide repeat protein [Spirochaetes bacterium]|nr:tetratricopeptide repeat protein [Spirochaetota bacterium]